MPAGRRGKNPLTVAWNQQGMSHSQQKRRAWGIASKEEVKKVWGEQLKMEQRTLWGMTL